MDHYFQLDPMLGPADQPMLEAYSALTYIAAVTSNVKLGALVTGVHYRYPGFLIKQVTNLDVLSGGRAYFGIGAVVRTRIGWPGFPFPATKSALSGWKKHCKSHSRCGRTTTARTTANIINWPKRACNPQPIAEPHPPIMIGGMGEKKTLTCCTICRCDQPFCLCGTDVLRHKLEVLRGHCEATAEIMTKLNAAHSVLCTLLQMRAAQPTSSRNAR